MKKYFKILSLALVLGVAMFAVVGCGGDAGSNSQSQDQGQQDQQQADSGSSTPETINLTLASGPAGGTWYPLGGAIGKVLQEAIPGVVVSVQQGGGEANVKGVHKGMYDLGITYSHTSVEGLNALGAFEEPQTNVVAITGLYPSALQLVVKADSDIQSVADLKGNRISPGRKGLSGETLTRMVLDVYGLSYDDMEKVERVSYSDSVNLIKDRQIDNYSPITTWPSPSIQEIALTGGVRLLPIDDDKMAALKEINPGYMTIVLPKDTYKGMEQDVQTVGSNATLVVRKDMDDELVYKITKALMENMDKLHAVHKSIEKNLSVESAPKDTGIELHEGAKKFYKEAGVL